MIEHTIIVGQLRNLCLLQIAYFLLLLALLPEFKQFCFHYVCFLILLISLVLEGLELFGLLFNRLLGGIETLL